MVQSLALDKHSSSLHIKYEPPPRLRAHSKVRCGWVGGGDGDSQKAFLSSAWVQTLDLGLEAWTKLNNTMSKA